jgi:hypothetical protein
MTISKDEKLTLAGYAIMHLQEAKTTAQDAKTQASIDRALNLVVTLQNAIGIDEEVNNA